MLNFEFVVAVFKLDYQRGVFVSNGEKILGYPKSEWVLAGIIFVVGAICVFTFMDSPAERVKAVEERAARYAEYHAAETKLVQSRLEGEKALEDADNAIRNEAAERRTRLEKASKQVRTTNRNGVRVDQYVLKRGGIIACTTTISGNSPAMFNCDGDV